ncbi:sulfotransferase 1C2 [Lingula anatina]|uniref:Sulfotransferase 1C2 n=1 Tax=Lingula anatina TaxID=7574 RepID=A0A2R2MTR4_LINAN|nr:sulfotransferase 1C2 [Lingula anatina]|eukprot:XP_023933670.1 sulfotransferase 1C2 [Lingula anatina]
MVFALIRNFFRTIYLLVMDLYHFPEVRNMVKSVLLGWRQAGKRIKLTDSEGNSFRAVVVKGIHLHPFPLVESNINNYVKFHAREDDVWIVNWPKSGTHWVYEVVKLLITGREELTDSIKEGTMFPEACAVESLEKLPSPRVLDTHVPLKLFPEEALKQSKIIYTIRNPKDAFVSSYYHMKNNKGDLYDGTWNGYFDLTMDENTCLYGSWFDHVADWMEVLENNPNALVVKYEDMKRDLKKEVRRIAEFLGYPKSEEVYENVTTKCSFGHMKKAKKEPKSFWKPGGSMYRKGIVGDWKNHFTVAQNEKFNTIFNEKQNKLRVSVDFDIKEGTMFPEACAVESLEKLPSPRVLDTHVPLKLFPEEALKKSKIIYTLRNPKDAFVSGYYHMKNDRSLVGYEGSWNGFFELFINENTSVYGSWFDHVADWMEVLENNPNALVVKYEDMKRDLKKEVRRVAEFLGYPKSEEVYENVTKKCSFGHMKKAKKEPKSFWKPGGSMYRKGIVGDWKNHFTVAQNEKFNTIFNEKQNKLRVSVDFEL